MSTQNSPAGEGFLILFMIYFGWLMDKKLVYTVKDTQGLHINLSHKNTPMKQYMSKFLKLIYIMEPF